MRVYIHNTCNDKVPPLSLVGYKFHKNRDYVCSTQLQPRSWTLPGTKVGTLRIKCIQSSILFAISSYLQSRNETAFLPAMLNHRTLTFNNGGSLLTCKNHWRVGKWKQAVVKCSGLQWGWEVPLLVLLVSSQASNLPNFLWIPESCLIVFLSTGTKSYLEQFSPFLQKSRTECKFIVSAFHLSGSQPP